MIHHLSLQPGDEFDRRLAANVHPDDWENPVPDGTYNLVVVGGGTAGLVTAAGAAGLGAKVALVERGLLGGDCLNVGCVPSKALIESARRADEVRRAGAFGVGVPGGPDIDFAAVMERLRRLRAGISPHDSAARFRELGVDVYFGQGRFTGSRTLEVGGRELTFKKACIATGARAAAPPVPGLENIDYLTNESLFSLTELPRRFGVVGAGPVGCEMAQAFARLGSEVYLVASDRGILPKEDRDAAAVVQESLERDGVRVSGRGKELRLEVVEAGQTRSAGARLRAGSHDGGYDVTVDRLLVAAGRAPNVEGLGLESIGVEFTAKGVVVDDRLRTTVPHIFAAGDICSPYQFTHAADFMARTVIRNALFMGRSKAGDLIIPWATYTDPELAHVGVSAAEAEAQGPDTVTFTQPLEGVDRAVLADRASGFVRVHARRNSGKIVGATAVGSGAGEIIGEITLAMSNGIGLGKVADTIHPYPTVAEAFRKVGDLFNKTRLTPRVQSAMAKWLAWSRR